MIICLFDTETTGVGSADDVLELASLLFKPGEAPVVYRQMMNPNHPIHVKATEAHGYVDADVRGFEDSVVVVPAWWNNVVNHAGTAEIILCAHNVSFDVRMISRHVPGAPELRTLCTRRLAENVVPHSPNHKLTTLYSFLGCTEQYSAHSALDDVKMTYHILQKLLKLSGKSLGEIVEIQNLKNKKQRKLQKIVSFGQFKGQPWSVVPKWYLEFVVRDVTDNVDANFTAQHYLEKLCA